MYISSRWSLYRLCPWPWSRRTGRRIGAIVVAVLAVALLAVWSLS